MTSAQVFETSVTNNCAFQNRTHRDHHTIRTNVVHSSISITEHYQQQDKLKEVESCLMHLDVTNLDIHQVRIARLGLVHTTPEEL